jgi:hypothetical protein
MRKDIPDCPVVLARRALNLSEYLIVFYAPFEKELHHERYPETGFHPQQKPATPVTPASNPQQTQGIPQSGNDKPGQQQQK